MRLTNTPLGRSKIYQINITARSGKQKNQEINKGLFPFDLLIIPENTVANLLT